MDGWTVMIVKNIDTTVVWLYLHLYCFGISKALRARYLYGERLLKATFSKDTAFGWLVEHRSTWFVIVSQKAHHRLLSGPAVVFNGCRLKGPYTVATEKWPDRHRSRWSPSITYAKFWQVPVVCKCARFRFEIICTNGVPRPHSSSLELTAS